MAGDQPVDLHALLRHARHRPGGTASTGEARLDDLLRQQSQRQAEAAVAEAKPAEISPLDRLRELFRVELVPVFDELRRKYSADGVTLEFDPSSFLSGGRDISIVVEYRGFGMRYHGTVLPTSIAFQQTRYDRNDRAGLAASGPTLRTRDLNGTSFREFVCERIASVVHAALQRRG